MASLKLTTQINTSAAEFPAVRPHRRQSFSRAEFRVFAQADAVEPDLSVAVNGLKMPNPFVIGSGPPGTNYKVMKRAFDDGWGAVIAKTVSLDAEKVINVTPRYAKLRAAANGSALGQVIGWQNIELISDRPLETMLKEFKQLKEEYPDRILIASIMEEYNKAAWEELIDRVEQTGVDALEINFSCPHGMPERKMGAAVGQDCALLEEVSGWINAKATVPVWAKMTPNITDITQPARISLQTGCEGVSAINTIMSVMGINLKTLRPEPCVEGYSTPGGYSAKAVHPIALAKVMVSAQVLGFIFLSLKMATRHLSRALQSATKPMSSILSHSYTTAAIPRSSLYRLRPVVAAATASYVRRLAPSVLTRAYATRQTSSSLNDPNPNWSNRPPKETILLDGCDFEHWLVVMEKPEADVTRDEIIDSYIKTLAMVIGSEEEARMKIYSVSTRHYFAFGALVPEEVSYKIKELPKVTWVLPDSYLDVRNKDYGGEPFINGQAVPYDPKYHEEWVRNNARANDRNRRNDRPRNNDRSRNFERRNMNSGGGGNFSNGPPAGNQQIDPKYQQNYPSQSPPQNAPNAGVMQPQNYANNNPGNYPPRGPPPPPANNNGPNYQYGASNGPAPYHSGPGSNQSGYVPGTVQGVNQNNINQAYVPPNTVSGNHYQNQNRGYVADGQNQGGYSAPQNAGYGQPQNQNTYGQGQNGYVPQNGGQGQNQGGGYVNPNLAGRDPNY